MVGLKDIAEVLFMAAEMQTLSTRAIEARVYYTRQDARCRLCKDVKIMVDNERSNSCGISKKTDKLMMVDQSKVVVVVVTNSRRK